MTSTTSMIAAVASMALFAAVAYGKDEPPAAQNVTTMWLGGKGESSFAEKVNALHAEMEAKGWKFSDLEIYTENGDMRGVFVTYTR